MSLRKQPSSSDKSAAISEKRGAVSQRAKKSKQLLVPKIKADSARSSNTTQHANTERESNRSGLPKLDTRAAANYAYWSADPSDNFEDFPKPPLDEITRDKGIQHQLSVYAPSASITLQDRVRARVIKEMILDEYEIWKAIINTNLQNMRAKGVAVSDIKQVLQEDTASGKLRKLWRHWLMQRCSQGAFDAIMPNEQPEDHQIVDVHLWVRSGMSEFDYHDYEQSESEASVDSSAP